MSGAPRPGTEHPELADTFANPSSPPASGGLSATRAESQADATAEVTLPRGAIVGRYLVLDVLGAGGMGVVYAAYDPDLDRKIALKLVRSSLDDGDARARMLREAQAIARLAHPNVVAVHDVGSHGDQQLFVAMELVDGATVSEWLRQDSRPNVEILGVFLQAGRGLAAAHRAGLVHRDFKPDNVLVGRDGRARVVDFGLVRQVVREEPFGTLRDPSERPSDPALSMQLTQVGAIMGTPYYMAPEQFVRGDTDARTDQYSFCVSLFEALCGRRPFEGDTFRQVSDKVLSGNIPDLQPIHTVPKHIRTAIRRGMSLDPNDRFPSMEALLAELEHFPVKQRRRSLIAGAAIAVAALSVFAISRALTRHDRAELCTSGDELIAEAWGPGQRRAIEERFRTSASPFSTEEAATVVRQLDAYATQWVRTQEASCRATNVQGEQSEELLDLRSGCLRQRKSELAALVGLLAAADERMIRRAHAAATSLSSISECSDVAALQAPVKLPSAPAARTAIAALRDQVAGLRAEVAARKRESLARAAELAARARMLGYQPALAESLVVLGQLRGYAGEHAVALDDLRQAFSSALTSHHDSAAVAAAFAIASSHATRSDLLAANEWLTVGTALTHRLGDDAERTASSHAVAGYVRSAEGKFAESAREYEQTLAIRERLDRNGLRVAVTLSGLAHAYDELGRYPEARAAVERSLAIQLPALGAWHPDIALLYLLLGNICDDEGDAGCATDNYKRALAIREKTNDQEGVANALNNLAVVAFGAERYDEALDYNRRALSIREAHDGKDEDVAMSLVNIGDIHRRLGRSAEALPLYERALVLAEEQVGKDHPYVGDALLGIGECKLALGDAAAALPLLERASAIRAAGARPIEVADVELALAKALWAQGQRDRATKLADSARKAFAGTPTGKRGLAELDRWVAARK